MKISFFFFTCMAICLWQPFHAQSTQQKHAIIPKPWKANWKEGTYAVPQQNTICYNSEAQISAKWLFQLLKNTNSETILKQDDKNNGDFNLKIDKSLENTLGSEGYKLKVTKSSVNLSAASETGLFYAIQTLRQMFPAEIENSQVNSVKLQQVTITDKPSYSWRGSMIDVARSFFGPEYLKRHIDRMALYKLNKFHLHLTDDQGWRIEIKSKPKLTEIGGNSSVRNGRSGFLTQKEYKEVQAYAAARHITLIPEIDMPGHTYAALRSYPEELNCENYSNLEPKRATPPEPFYEPNVGWSKFCLEKPEIYDFVSKVLGEIAEITTGPYIHIGGDEIDDLRYKEFMVKADSIVRINNKTSIGWEDVAKAEMSPSFISQRWNGQTKPSTKNIKTIESIVTSFYFDHGNVPGQKNTLNWGNPDGVSLEDTYTFTTNDNNVIGIEAPLWTETVYSDKEADNRFWPRSIAVAEVGWSKENSRDFTEFKQRLAEHGKRLDNMNVFYFRSPEVNWQTEDKNGAFSGFVPENITIKHQKTKSKSLDINIKEKEPKR